MWVKLGSPCTNGASQFPTNSYFFMFGVFVWFLAVGKLPEFGQYRRRWALLLAKRCQFGCAFPYAHRSRLKAFAAFITRTTTKTNSCWMQATNLIDYQLKKREFQGYFTAG